MGISNDIAPKHKPKPPEPPKKDLPELEKGEVEVQINKGEHEPVIEDIAAEHLLNAKDQQNIENKSSEIDDFFSNSPNDTKQPSPNTPKNPSPPTQNQKPKKKHGCAIVITILLILVLIAVVVWKNKQNIRAFFGLDSTTTTTQSAYESISQDSSFNDSIQDAESTEPADQTPDSTSASIETDSKTVTINPSGSVSTSESTETTPETTPETASATPSTTLLIKVLNGNGISGSAATVKTAIESAGYRVSYIGNALTFTYQKTTIYYKTGKSAEATAIAAVLSAYQTVLYLNDQVVGDYDLVVVAGKT
mgnify:CR=1 FL=1